MNLSLAAKAFYRPFALLLPGRCDWRGPFGAKALSLVVILTVATAPHFAAGDVDLIAAKQEQDARLKMGEQALAVAQQANDADAIASCQQQIKDIRSQNLWTQTKGQPAMTLQPGPEFHPFNFAIMSDLHLSERQGPQRLDQAMDLIGKRHDIAFVIVEGDLVWAHAPDAFKKILARANVPVHLVYGNNDWNWVENGSYEKEFGPRDYVFTYNNCTFIQMWDCLPRTHLENHKGELNEAQWAWLEQQLQTAQKNDAAHTFVSMHVPPDTPGAYNNLFFMFTSTQDRLYALFDKYHVTAGLFGHLHQSAEWMHGDTKMMVTPSNCWNFVSRSKKVDSSFIRIVKVEKDGISVALLPVWLPGETFTFDTLADYYNPKDHPK